MPTTPLRSLKPHPAQMRTVYDLDALATLTLQVATRGLDGWQPIVAAPSGDDLYIISGHRRQMAQLFALALAGQTDAPPTLEAVRAGLDAHIAAAGSLEAAVDALLDAHGDHPVPYVRFSGDAQAQILALQAANYGRAAPDPLGIARSFRAAVEAGATPGAVARNVGQSVATVHTYLALTEVDDALAQRIAAGELPLGVAPVVADLPEPPRSGVTRFILAHPPGAPTAKEIRAVAAVLKTWPGLQPPMLVKHPSQRNLARALVRLWQQAAAAYPADAYAAAALLISRDQHDEPWAIREKLDAWFEALGGDTYYGAGGVNWTAVVDHLLPEVSCRSCPVGRLPPQTLQSDLSQGQGGPLGMPCRVGEDAARCLHGLAPGDPFDVRVPWSWAGHPGVVQEAGVYRVRREEDLLAAWRAQIAAFMQHSAQAAASHPFATPCSGCRHRLERSPTQDETVPACAWAARLRRVSFRELVPDQNGLPRIAVCRQYAPDRPWSERVPDHPQPPGVPVSWLKSQIRQLVAAANRQHTGRAAFEFLTGRPMRANEPYGDWFATQLAEQSGELRPAQLFTLFIWAHAERQRAGGDPIDLPLDDHAMQFAPYRERRWIAPAVDAAAPTEPDPAAPGV